MHDSKLIHRDIKSANLLVNLDCSVRVCDFSLARSLTSIKVFSSKIVEAELKSKNEYSLTQILKNV
jgi:mitogen-activated protein kinase 1/3